MNSVLSAIPIYFMACFQLPQWLLKRMDKIRRSFLWGENDHITNGVSLINWASVCTPKQWGGMGVSSLKYRNISLMLRWWWRAYDQPNSLSGVTITVLKSVRYKGGPRFRSSLALFFGSV